MDAIPLPSALDALDNLAKIGAGLPVQDVLAAEPGKGNEAASPPDLAPERADRLWDPRTVCG